MMQALWRQLSAPTGAHGPARVIRAMRGTSESHVGTRGRRRGGRAVAGEALWR